MHHLRRRDTKAGFTIVELMVVVVILAVLASIAVVGYRKYIARARTSEAMVVLAEMVSREQIYKLEFAAYFPLRNDGNWATGSPFPTEDPQGANSWGLNEDADAFYPVPYDIADFESSRTAFSINNPAAWPASWRALGLRPRETQLYCTYLTNAGNALGDTDDPTKGPGNPPDNIPAGYGQRPLGATSAVPWFYCLASCNLAGGQAGSLDDTSVFIASSLSPNLGVHNEGK